MKSVIISGTLIAITIVAIIINAIYMYNFSTDMLNIVFSLPSEMSSIEEMSGNELEECKQKINKVKKDWEDNTFYITFISKFSEFEKTNNCVINLREYFFSGEYGLYLSERLALIQRIEKQKHNEIPNIENIF